MHASYDQPRSHGKFSYRHRTGSSVELGGSPLLDGQPAPLVELSGLTHVGTLNAADKGGTSYEGQGLSVSLHPDAWQQIARLGGNPVWSIGETGRFLNYHELTTEQLTAITDYGLTAGYIKLVTAYKVTWYDEDDEADRWFIIADADEAEDEAEFRDADIEPVTAFAATSTFPDTTVQEGDLEVEEILATVWVNETTELDGVWWEDRYDPDALSAPRGVIAPNRVEAWVATATPRIG